MNTTKQQQKSQIFRKKVPREIFTKFLRETCEDKSGIYTYNIESFKKGILFGQIEAFKETCEPYYIKSKRKYLEKNTYKSLMTILRQIANSQNIKFDTELKYHKSEYNTVYKFHVYE